MAKPFHELRERLLRAGVAPRHVRRYLAELSDHLADLRAEEVRAGRSRADADRAALARLGSTDDLARAMEEKRQLRSWCARAPWAVFGVAPLLLVLAAYFVACFILWSGWKIFMPGAATPFGMQDPGPVYGVENIYFQTGRMIYFGAPIFIGWAMGAVAARHRLKALWPVIGLAILALIGSAAQVHTTRTIASGSGGNVSMSFVLGTCPQNLYLAVGYCPQDFSLSLLHAGVFFLLAVAPYILWRLRAAFFPA